MQSNRRERGRESVLKIERNRAEKEKCGEAIIQSKQIGKLGLLSTDI